MSSINLDEPPYTPGPSEFAWKAQLALARVYALNERCLEVITDLARSERHQSSLAIVNEYRTLWRRLSVTARFRAAHAPFLLLDVHFKDVEWWQAARDRSNRRTKLALCAAFKGKFAGELMRETLMLAWSTVAFDRGAASIMLGMTPSVSSIIAVLGPQDVERIAARHSPHLEPRWKDFPAFWGKLLVAAHNDDDEALHEVHLHGAQLIGGELLPLLSNGHV